MHIGFGPNKNSEVERINAVTLSGLPLNEGEDGFLVTSLGFGPVFNQTYGSVFFDAPYLKGDNRYILLANNNNSTDRKIQSLFHEIAAHNFIPDNNDSIDSNEHMIFSGHPDGHTLLVLEIIHQILGL